MDQPRNIQELKDLLNINAVNYELWSENKLNESELCYDENNVLCRKAIVIFLVIKKKINDQTKYLIEYEQKLKKAGYKSKCRQILLAEKMANDGSLEYAAQRAVLEELGSNGAKLTKQHKEVIYGSVQKDSCSYPGLMAQY
jgi:hypothetical protein